MKDQSGLSHDACHQTPPTALLVFITFSPLYTPTTNNINMAVNGDTLYRKAETTLNSKTGWFSGVSKEEKLEVIFLNT
jgi:hypothetical protein